MIEIAYHIFTALIAASVLCCLWRLWKGPSLADRINAADVIALACIGLAVGYGWKNGDALWLDFAMVAGLVLFVGTTALSLYLDPNDLGESEP
ncbi:MAG: monovalent cation/H+ antiporter complex subunit F [Verrucomicrobiota bacterium]